MVFKCASESCFVFSDGFPVISFRTEGLTGKAVVNLINMVASREKLLNRSVGAADAFHISKDFLGRLQEKSSGHIAASHGCIDEDDPDYAHGAWEDTPRGRYNSMDEVIKAISDAGGEQVVKGLAFSPEVISFPGFSAKCYGNVICGTLCGSKCNVSKNASYDISDEYSKCAHLCRDEMNKHDYPCCDMLRANYLTEHKPGNYHTYCDMLRANYLTEQKTGRYHICCDILQAYYVLAQKMLEYAGSHRWVKSRTCDYESERYSFRTWLNMIGMKGNAYFREREILMRNLSGNTVFRSEEKKAAFDAARRKHPESQVIMPEFILL